MRFRSILAQIPPQAILIALVFFCYAGSFFHGFVSDDKYGIVQNASISSFTSVVRSIQLFVQPLVYFLIANTFGIYPFWFRLLNILAHLGTSIILYSITKRHSKHPVALAAAALFAVHPVATESVVWISGGAYVWYTFFFLMSLWYYTKLHESSRNIYISICWYTLALFTSPLAIPLFAIYAVYMYLFEREKKPWLYLIPYAGVSGLSLLVSLTGFAQRAGIVVSQGIGSNIIFHPLYQIPYAISFYLRLFVWPHNLSLYQSEISFDLASMIVAYTICLVFLAYMAYAFWKKQAVILFAGCFFLIALSPTLTPTSLHWIVADRYMYPGLIGLSVLFASTLSSFFPKKVFVSMITVVVILFMGRTIVRTMDWKDEDTLWLSMEQTAPSDPRTYFNVADTYMRRGDYDTAIAKFRRSISLGGNQSECLNGIGMALQQKGTYSEAKDAYAQSIQADPKKWHAYQNLSALLITQGEYATAEAFMRKAAELNGSSAELFIHTGVLAMKNGRPQDALQAFILAVQIDPSNQTARQWITLLQNSTTTNP